MSSESPNFINDPTYSAFNEFTTTMASLVQNDITFKHQHHRHKNDLLWAIILGSVFVLVMAFGLAGNSTSNGISTIVGAKILNMKHALILNICFQLAACIYVAFAGGKNELQFVIELASYDKHRTNLLLGQVAMIIGLTVWLLFTTYKKLPISSGHSVVGATIAFSVVLDGFHAIRWRQIVSIVLSWIISPVLSGIAALTIYALVDYFVLRKKKDIEWKFPIIFALTAFVNSFVIILATVRDFGLFTIPLHLSFVSSTTIGGIVALLVVFFIGPMLHEHINCEEIKLKKLFTRDPPTIRISRFKVKKVSAPAKPSRFKLTIDGKTQVFNRIRKTGAQKVRCALSTLINRYFHIENRENEFSIEYQFGAVLLFTSCFSCFLQSVQNLRQSIVPLRILLLIYRNEHINDCATTSPLLLCYVMPAVCLGIYLWGGRVTQTMGNQLATLHPISGFAAQAATTLTIIIAHHIGIPISTSHCLIGAIIAVGLIENRENSVDWKATKQVLIYSALTLPSTFILVALFSYFLHFAL